MTDFIHGFFAFLSGAIAFAIQIVALLFAVFAGAYAERANRADDAEARSDKVTAGYLIIIAVLFLIVSWALIA